MTGSFKSAKIQVNLNRNANVSLKLMIGCRLQGVGKCSNNCDVIMSAMASQITGATIVYSTVYQRKYQSSVSLAFVRGIHRWSVKSPHKGPVPRKVFPFDDVIMVSAIGPQVQMWCEIVSWWKFRMPIDYQLRFSYLYPTGVYFPTLGKL